MFRKLAKQYRVIERAQGVYLYDQQGKQYLDGCSGACVVNLGHGHKKIIHAMHSQVAKLAYTNALHFACDVVENYTTELAKLLPAELNKISLLSSGSEAVEAACKLAIQYWQARGEKNKNNFIALEPSYHGNTLLALSLSGRPLYKKSFEAILSDKVWHVDAPNRYVFGKNYDQDGASFYLDNLQRKVEDLGSENVAAIIIEPVSGMSLGGNTLPQGFAAALKEFCEKNKILLIADEVLCGAGRTGSFSAIQQLGICPDILIQGKGLGSGYAPLSMLATKESLVDALKSCGQNLMHAQTFMFHPVAAAVGNAVITAIREEGLLTAVREKGKYLEQLLFEKFADHPHIHVTEAVGLLRSIEIVSDKEHCRPFESSEQWAVKLCEHALEQGLVLWPVVGHRSQNRGDLLVIAPPFTSQNSELEELVDKLYAAVASILP